MLKTLLISFTLLTGFAGSSVAQKAKQKHASSPKTEVKFLDEIEVEIAPSSIEDRSKLSDIESKFFAKRADAGPASSSILIESASRIQLKFALLLDTEVEQILNFNLYNTVDEWLGTRYRLGGTNKDGIDCSALAQLIYATQYGISLPRTAHEQYEATQHLSRTELKEGDLVFFNTQGGVSHVGIYLQNNKFFHASSSGVTISDLYDPYWDRRFVGVGRFQKPVDAFAYSKL